MNEQLRAKAGLVYNVVESVILAMSVGLTVTGWKMIIQHESALSAQGAVIGMTSSRITKIEDKGSAGLASHVAEDDKRVLEIDRRLEKLEAAVLVLQQTPGELKSISVRLDGIERGQGRIEKALEEHTNRTRLP